MAFRRWFFKLSELRSLVTKNTVFMAVTATATQKTRYIICNVLRLQDFVDIFQSPNKANITFAVQYMNKQITLIDHFKWLLLELKNEKASTGRTIIYCQTIKQCSQLYSLFVRELGMEIKKCKKRVVEMLHSLSSNSIKQVVLEEMGKEEGCIKVLICTIAFGMGVNCKGVNKVIHFGPSKSIEAYIQESGRAGRDGKPSWAILFYQSLMLINVDQEMKEYVRGRYNCRRQFLMGHFLETSVMSADSGSNCICCDLCCKDVDLLPNAAIYGAEVDQVKTRLVSAANKEVLQAKLVMLRKSIFLSIFKQAPKGNLPVISRPDTLFGFQDTQITQVLENCDKIFKIPDVKKYVEIWKEVHAYAILGILAEVFGDIDKEDLKTFNSIDDTVIDEHDSEWNHLISDEELYYINWDDLSCSNIFAEDTSLLDDSMHLDVSSLCTLPEFVSDLIDNIHIQ